MNDATKSLIGRLTQLLAQPCATDPDLFPTLDAKLRQRGYKFTAEQRGIYGTYVRVEKIGGDNG